MQAAQAPFLLTNFPLSQAKIFKAPPIQAQRKTPAPQVMQDPSLAPFALYYLGVHMALLGTLVPPFLLAAIAICIM